MNKQKFTIKDTTSGRTYLIGGRGFTSVTTPLGILSAPSLKLWEIRVGKTRSRIIANKASNYGTKIHHFAQLYCEGKRLVVKKKYKADVDAFKVWFDENVEEVLMTKLGYGSELTVYSDEYMLAGTMDIVCRLKGRPGIFVIDIKTGRIKVEHWLQLSAYRRLLIESCDFKPEELTNRIVLHIRAGKCKEVVQDKKHPEREMVSAERDWLVYLSTLHVWRWYQELKKLRPKRKKRKSKNKGFRPIKAKTRRKKK